MNHSGEAVLVPVPQTETPLTRGKQAAKRPRVLFFSQNAGWPADTGARLRNFHLARSLSGFADVTWLGFSEHKQQSNDNVIGEICQHVVNVPQPRRYTTGKLLRGFTGRTPLTILNYATSEMTERLSQLFTEHEFDIVQMGSIVLYSYLSVIASAPVRPKLICDWHNIESEVLHRYSARTANPARRWYAQITASRVQAHEKALLRHGDAHLVVSERDRDRLLAMSPQAHVHVIENGVDTGKFACQPATENLSGRSHRVLFVGSMDYHANIDAVLWFAREIWPAIQQIKPELIFTITGRRPAAEVLALAKLPGIEVTGTVDDVLPYYREAIASVVPLRVGGGSRLKILEAMAAGVPVVSTTLGAEGLDVSDGVHLCLADTPQTTRQALVNLFTDESYRQDLVKQARQLALTQYDWSIIGQKLQRTCQAVLNYH